ncbi:Transcription initiation factor IIF subunit beta [Neolecta irregularis DAH-3]|uniref:Transcription initiation factor IIF subunit beta n=1 Tax=Neolecta irregularis (strain DAH-3) TaxID=1198029 RepID=A0A1U7LVN8_NEOID|nr:Transcription initiation factor IIF subunit beta [Neolecta irregularis DAH-3]|eukprot:OLL26689.1 Transcription initiation factor IIF subunit beta [Neolecta irregularis DAH-3]
MCVSSINTPHKKQLKLLLPDNPTYSDIPIEYDLQIQNRGVENVYVFTEKDIPGVPPPDLSLPFYDRPPVPKQTAIAGKVIYECNAKPIINARYSHYMKQRNKAAVPQRQARMLNETSFHGTVLAPGTTGASAGRFNSFTKGTKMIKTGSSTDLKMTRLPKNELLDLLFKCFHDYEYWSLKGLREIVRQPEVYLKEILEDIAILNKRGPYALKWCLKPEFKGTKPSNEVNMDRRGDIKKDESSDENMEDV